MEQEQWLEQAAVLAGGRENLQRTAFDAGVLTMIVKDRSLVQTDALRALPGVTRVEMGRTRLRVETDLFGNKEDARMAKYTDMAGRLIELVGGKDNVNDVLHCMTRLRFRLKDESKFQEDAIRKVPGVLGVQKNIGEFQIVIGPKVDDVYQEVVRVGGFAARDAVPENPDEPAAPRKLTLKALGGKLFELISGCITPVIPTFVVMGMLNTIAALLGPSVLGLLAADSDAYVLLTGMASAVTYFLPFLLAFSASRKLGANTIVSLVMAAILLSPTISNAVAAGEPFTVFGIPMTLVDYSTTFLPILLIVAVQVYVEKFLNRITPDVLKAILVPTLTVLVMAVMGLCLLGPIGQWLGNGLAALLIALSEHAGFLEGALVAALYPFLVAFGMGGPVFLATFAIYTQTGLDYLYFPFMAVYGMCIEGVATAYIIKSRKAADREIGLVALVSQALGGVSEPTIYGILFKNRTCLLVEVIASAIGGFYIGLTHTAMINLTVSVPIVGPFLMFAGQETANLVNGCIGVALAFVLGLVGTLVFYRPDSDSEPAEA